MTQTPKANLFDAIPNELSQEWFQTLLDSPDVKIERIVSKGHASPAGFWYDQEWDEWVLLLKGSAGLRFEGQDEILALTPGDWVLIPSKVKHRVDWTDERVETVWLAVHLYGGRRQRAPKIPNVRVKIRR
jgi:cupin 2 domain-containing protein